jgi:hypothetical protein
VGFEVTIRNIVAGRSKLKSTWESQQINAAASSPQRSDAGELFRILCTSARPRVSYARSGIEAFRLRRHSCSFERSSAAFPESFTARSCLSERSSLRL